MGDAWINMGDAMMFGRGRCRESGAENNRSRKRNFYLAEHFRVFRLGFATRLESKMAGGMQSDLGCSCVSN
jgi:hypothetical protein